MNLIHGKLGLYTDFYELTMAQGYFLTGKNAEKAGFDYFFRKNSFGGGYVVFAGLETLLNILEDFRFEKDDCKYLESVGFDKSFLEYLKNFRFNGDIYSVQEGEVVFPNEPLLRVEGNLIESQLIESILLNIVNFQSLIATKAARIRHAAKDKLLLEFGLRRAQGLGAIHASRAALIGGFDKTSNTFSAKCFNLEPSGTMAHSWIQSFESELDAFRKYAGFYPDSSILLVDTYDTLKSGLPNAIKVAKEMESRGKRLKGVRLDSGDLAYLSKKTRKMLDDAGLNYITIVASNQLDEYVIRSLLEQNAPIDAFGVGTSVATGMKDAQLDGVYKLSAINDEPAMKVSENLSKMTLPGLKKIYRYFDQKDNMFYADGIELSNSNIPETIYHPHDASKNTLVSHLQHEEILNKVMKNGRVLTKSESIKNIVDYSQQRIGKLPGEIKRFENPHIYKVGIGKDLMKLRDKLRRNYEGLNDN